MANDRLRDAMLKNGLTPAAVADHIGVDPKTVERWITQGRIPYPRHRYAIAAAVRESETYLWPDALAPERAAQVAQSEVVHIYPRRSAVPSDIWQRLLDKANSRIGILAYAGLFLPEQNPRWVSTMKAKADLGAQVEILLGDPESPHVAERGNDEGIGGAMASKVHNVLAFYKDLREHDNVGIYFHATTLYNSIYRFDDEMLVNTHLYGTPAAYAPVLHLRQLAGGDLFESYSTSFAKVLAASRAVWPES
jgi:transcriptional regulator with XRE-family HTH domain